MKANLWIGAALLGLAPLVAQSAPMKGDREFQVSGNGTSDKDSNKNVFDASGSLAWYLTDSQRFGVRRLNVFAGLALKPLSKFGLNKLCDDHKTM